MIEIRNLKCVVLLDGFVVWTTEHEARRLLDDIFFRAENFGQVGGPHCPLQHKDSYWMILK